MAAISLFWYTNMAAVTSDENDLLKYIDSEYVILLLILDSAATLCALLDFYKQQMWLDQCLIPIIVKCRAPVASFLQYIPSCTV
jgi:hypothetical protein